MYGIGSKIQIQFKKSSSSLLLLGFRVFTGAMLGLTFALIGDEMISYGQFIFTFVIVAICLSFLRISRYWSFIAVVVFNLVCILVGMLLRFYIMVGPGT